MKVLSKQHNSRMCMVCGMDNPFGIKAQFYNMEDGSAVSPFRFAKHHQSYPGRVHGGMITSVLDELGLRAAWAKDNGIWGVTMSLEVKFRKPVPYDTPLFAKGIVLSKTSKFLKTKAYIFDTDGARLSEADICYLILPPENISDADCHEEMCYYIADDILSLDCP